MDQDHIKERLDRMKLAESKIGIRFSESIKIFYANEGSKEKDFWSTIQKNREANMYVV